jgi:hypothetical protein
MLEEDKPPPDRWPLGVVLALTLNLIQFMLTPLNGTPSLGFSPVCIGVSQLLYIFPVMAFYLYKKRNDMVKGLIVGASFTFLLNAACIALI